MPTAANPYASVLLTAHGVCEEHMKALPPLSHPDLVF